MSAACQYLIRRRTALANLGMAGLTVLGMHKSLAGTSEPGKTLRVAVVPQLTPLEMSRYWTPVLDALGRAGYACELVVYPSIARFEPEFLKGTADLVFLNPYHMVMAHKAHGYIPLLRDTRPLEGVLVVKAEGVIQHIDHLKSQRVSFPAPNAFAASLYIRSVLDRQHHLPIVAHYAQNHSNAIRQVISGDSQAAGVVKTTLEKEAPEVLRELRILYTSPPLPSHPIAVHPRVPTQVRSALIDVFSGLALNPDSQALMAGIQMPKPIRADYKKDYAFLEKLSIEKYVLVE